MPAGRPTDYNEEVASRICDSISSGMSLRKVCEQEGFPSKATVFKWLARHPSFKDQYAQAVIERSRARVDEMLDIAKEADDVQRARLMIDVIKWQASKEDRALYGDRTEQVVKGDPENPVYHKVERVIVRPKN